MLHYINALFVQQSIVVNIGFVSATYNASEADTSVEVCGELVSGETDIAVQVELSTQPGNAQGILK